MPNIKVYFKWVGGQNIIPLYIDPLPIQHTTEYLIQAFNHDTVYQIVLG